ncbi:MAG: hypothetical protein LBS09_06065 [Bacteroidales bacterium]|jgi:hypothetical protein|nr:hypothetical protein [Bacteroidales bacterium]
MSRHFHIVFAAAGKPSDSKTAFTPPPPQFTDFQQVTSLSHFGKADTAETGACGIAFMYVCPAAFLRKIRQATGKFSDFSFKCRVYNFKSKS